MVNDPSPPAGDTFCISPFIEASVMPTGAVRACCAFLGSISQNGRPMSVYEHSVEEIWNSDDMRAIRKKMVEGQPVTQCWYCSTAESRGEPSMRKDLNKGWEFQGYGNPRNETIEQLKATAVANDYRMPQGPAWIDLELGNLCNLKCRMCSSTWSSSIANDPVQSRWSTYDIEVPARWQARAMVIAPRRALGIEYEGLSALDRAGDAPLAWLQGAASIRMKSGGREVSSVQIRLTGGEEGVGPVEVFANGAPVFQGELSNGALDQTFALPEAQPDVDELVLRLQCPVRVGVEEIKLLRAETGKSSVGLSRFSSGKQWYQDEKFLIDDLLYKAENITKLHMVGGEPLLIKEARSIMKRLIADGVAKNVLLSLVTNGTIANDEVCELSSQFRGVMIGISLDGVGAINDYIRSGSNWTEIEPNITKLRRIPNCHIYINLAYQAYNMLHVTDVAQFAEDVGIGFRYEFLVGPAHLSCIVMPREARDEAVARIRRFVAREAPTDETTRLRRAAIHDSLIRLADVIEANNGPHDPKLLEEFMAFTNDLDLTRGQNFASVHPELLGFIEAAGVRWSESTRFAKYGVASGRSLQDRTTSTTGVELREASSV